MLRSSAQTTLSAKLVFCLQSCPHGPPPYKAQSSVAPTRAGKGFPGGGGGGGAGENGGGTQGGTGSATVGGENGTAGTAGKIGGNGGKGGGTATWEGYPPGEGDPSVGSKSTGGNGGVGGGPYGGAGGPTPTPPSYDGQNAGRGGYNNTGVNDELSIGTFCSQYRGLNVDKDPLFQYIMNEFKMTNGKWVVGGCRCFDRCSVS
jgi:hypothetical protein